MDKHSDTVSDEIFVSADTESLMQMIRDSVKQGSFADLKKIGESVDPDGVHIFFNADRVDNKLRTMWWVKTLTCEEPIIMVFKVRKKVFGKYSKLITTSFDENGEYDITWHG